MLRHNMPSRNCSSSISFARLICLAILIAGLSLVTLFVLQYGFMLQFHANLMTYLLSISHCVLLYYIANPQPQTQPIETIPRLAIALVIVLVFLQRVIILIIFPLSFDRLDGNMVSVRPYELSELNWAILTYTLIVAVFFLGIKLATKAYVPEIKGTPKNSIYLESRSLLFFLSCICSLFFMCATLTLGWKMGAEWESGWISRLLPTSFFILVLMLLWIQYSGDALTMSDKGIIVVIVSIYIFTSLIGGSRGGLYSIALLLAAANLNLRGNFQVRKRLLCGLMLVLIVVGPVSWVVGTAIRSDNPIIFSNEIGEWQAFVLKISRRLASSTDNFIMAINNWGDELYAEQYLSLGNIARTTINGCVPGEIFATPYACMGKEWTRLVWPEYYREDHINGEQWSIFAQFYLMYGYVMMIMLVWIFAFCATKVFRYFWLKRTFVSLLIACLVLRVFFFDVLEGVNIDQLVNNVFFCSYQVLAIHICVSFFKRARSPISVPDDGSVIVS